MNLGWQTHFFNMVFTPSKAVSSMIAAEVMRRIRVANTSGIIRITELSTISG